jgi:hypothetical protein
MVAASIAREDVMAFQYAAKFICGVSKDEGQPVARGRYSTVVNVHNPQQKDEAEFRYKLAVAGQGDNGNISDFKDIVIKPDGAIYFDCKVVRATFDAGDPLLDGFLVIESKRYSLDVVAVYTTNDFDGNGVPAIDVERVFEREI